MSKTLNFNTAKKTFMTVTLTDGTVLLVGTPTKKIFDELISIQDNTNASNDADSLNALYDICALVLSRNKAGKVITREYLEETFDIEDIITLFRAYVEFVKLIKNVKN